MHIGIAVFNFAACLDPVHFLHTHIHQYELRIKYRHFRQGLGSITGFSHNHQVRFRFKCGTQSQAYYLVIVNNHNARLCHNSPVRWGCELAR